MVDSSRAQPVAFNCEGGLVLNRSSFLMKPGEALVLENFEPDVEGGYRRINGHRKYVNQIVPVTSADSEKAIGVATFGSKVLACRGEKIFSTTSAEITSSIAINTGMTGSGTINVTSVTGFATSGAFQINSELFTYTGVDASSTPNEFTGVTRAREGTSAAAHALNDVISANWTEIDTGRTNAVKYRFERFNFDGNEKIVFVDEVNAPVVFNLALSATDVSASSVAGAKFVSSYKDHMFYAGKSTTPQEVVFSAPFNEDDFTSGNGAGSIKVDDTITGLKVFRDSLFIFCENRIFKLTGSATSDFRVVPVTRNIGCINGDTI